MTKNECNLCIIVMLACCLWVSTSEARDCSVIDQLRSFAKADFSSIRGELDGDTGDFNSLMRVDGARCHISGVESGSPTHNCYWIIGRDKVAVKAIFEQMALETSVCVINSEPPIRNDETRSSYVLFYDGPKRGVRVSYDFFSGWYRIDLEYTVYKD